MLRSTLSFDLPNTSRQSIPLRKDKCTKLQHSPVRHVQNVIGINKQSNVLPRGIFNDNSLYGSRSVRLESIINTPCNSTLSNKCHNFIIPMKTHKLPLKFQAFLTLIDWHSSRKDSGQMRAIHPPVRHLGFFNLCV